MCAEVIFADLKSKQSFLVELTCTIRSFWCLNNEKKPDFPPIGNGWK